MIPRLDRTIHGISLLALLTLHVGSQAIIIRHDVGPQRYEARPSDFPAVFYLERQGARKVCAATIIHRQWALTAAHCVEETLLGDTVYNRRRYAVEVANSPREIDRAIIHPNYSEDSNTDVDLALLRFREPATLPRPMPLQLEETEQGQIVNLLGWGFFGFGTTGRLYDDGEFRRAQNRIDEAGRRLRIAFDDPRQRGSDALELEGMPGLGDSGGPALIEAEIGYRLAGVAVGEVEGVDFSEETQGKYGSVAVYERVSQHLQWIEAVIGEKLPFDS